MEQGITITPEELYYLGEQMGALYMDYDYVASMEDIQMNSLLYESRVKTGLAAKGLLEEDFSGNIELSEWAKELLKPVFFATFESSVDYCGTGGEEVETVKFYGSDDGMMRMVSREGRGWKVCPCSSHELLGELERRMPKEDAQMAGGFDPGRVSHIFVFKHVWIGDRSTVKIFFHCDNHFYTENQKEEIIPADRRQVLDEAERVLLPEGSRLANTEG